MLEILSNFVSLIRRSFSSSINPFASLKHRACFPFLIGGNQATNVFSQTCFDSRTCSTNISIILRTMLDKTDQVVCGLKGAVLCFFLFPFFLSKLSFINIFIWSVIEVVPVSHNFSVSTKIWTCRE